MKEETISVKNAVRMSCNIENVSMRAAAAYIRLRHRPILDTQLLVSLQDGIRDEGSRDLSATKPTTVQALDCVLGRFDVVELNIDLALRQMIE